jgi:peptidylprolyl isomerase
MRIDDTRTGAAAKAPRHGVRRLALVLLPLLLGAAADAPTDVVAQRGDVKLTAADIRDLVDHTDPPLRTQLQTNPEALAEFVRDRLLRRTLLNEAHASKFDETPDVVAKANDARDTVVMQLYLISKVPADPNFPSSAEIAAAYEANKTRFMVPKQYHVAQIAILVPIGAAKEVDEEARRKAQALRAQVLKPKADFGEVAKKESQDKGSADHGGDMGWLREDQLTPSVRDAVANLPENGITDPVRSPDSWHVVKLLGVKPAGPAPLDQVQDQIVQALRQNRTQQMARTYVEDLLRKEPIQLNEIDLARRVNAVR